jgi:hypothetical protein
MKTENAGKAATEFISKLNYKNTKMLNHSELSVFFVNFVVKKAIFMKVKVCGMKYPDNILK